jgi:hypothetical protein
MELVLHRFIDGKSSSGGQNLCARLAVARSSKNEVFRPCPCCDRGVAAGNEDFCRVS